MSDHRDTPSGPRPDDAREPRLETLRLVRAIGSRLGAGRLDGVQRDALVTTLAQAASGDELARRRAARGPARGRRLAAAAAALVVVAGTVGIVTRGDDLPVIVLAGGAAITGAPSLDAAGGAEVMRADASPMIGLWTPTIFRFELADGVAIDASRGTAWRMAAPADLTAAAARLAAQLDVAAPTPAEWDTRSLLTQQEDGANLWVSATGDWYYGGPSDLWPVWDCPEPAREPSGVDPSGVDPGGRGEPGALECTPPAPPVGVPSAERARALALELLARVGHADVRVIDVMVDEWGAYVQAELVLPGSAASSGVFVGVGFAGAERISWANGTLARPERLGDYPLIDLRAALVRLESDMNAWLDSDSPTPMPRPFPADAGDVATTDGDVPTSDADGPVTILPLPDMEAPDDRSRPGMPPEEFEPVERTVRIVSVELITSLVWTAGDDVVLLPHFRLIDAEGGWWFVIAVEDRYLVR